MMQNTTAYPSEATYFSVNNTTTASPTGLTATDQEQLKIVATIGFFLLLFATFANAMTLAAIYCQGWWKTGLHVLIINLTLANLTSAFIIYPATLLNMTFGRVLGWTNEWYCRIQGYFFISAIFLSPLLCMLIALNQFFVIVAPASWSFFKSRKCAFMAVIFTDAVVYGIFLIPLFEIDGKMGATPPFQYCGWVGYLGSKAMGDFHTDLVYVASGLVVPVCYIAVFLRLYLHDRVLAAASEGSVLESVRMRRKYDRRLRVTTTMFVSFLGYIWTFVPLPAVHNYYGYRGFRDPRFSVSALIAWLFLLYWVGTCFTPVVYYTLNKDFREAYKDVLRRALRRNRIGVTRAETSGPLATIGKEGQRILLE